MKAPFRFLRLLPFLLLALDATRAQAAASERTPPRRPTLTPAATSTNPAPSIFTVPVYDRTNPNRIIARLSGALGRLQLSHQQPLDDVRVEYYDEQGGTNLVVEGTQCVYDARARVAFSPATLRVASGDARIRLEGMGFIWWQTNNDLFISNQVQTLLRPGPTPSPEQALRITAHTLHLQYESNLITYAGSVRVQEARLDLETDFLRIRRAGFTGVEQIEADGGVLISDRLTGGRTRAQRAVYRVAPDHETLELLGEPEWQEGDRRATATRFLLDLNRQTLEAIGDAHLRFSVASAGTPTLLGLPGDFSAPTVPTPSPPAGSPTPSATSSRMIELLAQLIIVQLPTTNHPGRRMFAHTNVVILDPTGPSQAQAAHLSFDELGILELTGDPRWTAGARWLQADTLRYDTSNRVFEARPNARVHLPLADLNPSLARAGTLHTQTNFAFTSNHVATLECEALSFRSPWIRFENAVRGEIRDRDQPLGTLRCQTLAVNYTNRLEEVRADGEVRLDQLPFPPATTRQVSRELRCEQLRATFDPAGHLATLAAERDVAATQTLWTNGVAGADVIRLLTDRVHARFRGPTNALEQVAAEGHVNVSQGPRRALAGRAVYDGPDEKLTLTEQPVIQLPEGQLTDAHSLVWDRRSGKYRGLGKFKSLWRQVPGMTNPLPSVTLAPR